MTEREKTNDEILLAATGSVIVWTLEDLERRKNTLLSQVLAAFKSSRWAYVHRYAGELDEIERRITILQDRQRLQSSIAASSDVLTDL